VAFALVGLGWQLEADHNKYVLPHPRAVFSQLVDRPGFFFRNGRSTLVEALIGLAIGLAVAFVLAVIMSRVRVIERAVMPLAVILSVTPVVAVAPALVVAFGFGRTPKVIVTALITFFPFLINTLIGLRSADPDVVDVMRTLKASNFETLWRVQLPSSLPYLFGAARICLPLSVIGAVVAEFEAPGATAGLGTMITQASSNSQLPVVYAAIICLAILGVGLTIVISVVERRALSWHHSQRRDR
jgi:NitT/TauT family transport system permease protein